MSPRAYLESPPLPRAVWAFELRRELRAITPPRAFWLGLGCGALAVLAVWIVLGL